MKISNHKLASYKGKERGDKFNKNLSFPYKEPFFLGKQMHSCDFSFCRPKWSKVGKIVHLGAKQWRRKIISRNYFFYFMLDVLCTVCTVHDQGLNK